MLLITGAMLISAASLNAQVQNSPGAPANGLLTWNTRTSPTNSDLRAITYGNGRFVTVGRNGTVLSSPDGAVWTRHVSGVTKTLYGVAYGNGIFTAIGAGGTAVTSPDGAIWTEQDTDTTANFNSLRFANGLFLAAGDSGYILVSPNGATWIPHRTVNIHYWQSITFADSRFVAVGYDYRNGRAQFGVTSDFSNWNIDYTGNSRYLNDIVYATDKFVAVGYGGTLQTSPDGSTWSPTTNANTSRWLFDLTYAGGLFMAVGESGSMTISTNGIHWSRQTSGVTKTLNGVAFGANTFVVVGEDGTILQSNPISTAPASIALSQAAKNGNQFGFHITCQAGSVYEIQVSTNLVSWSPVGTLNATNSAISWQETTTQEPMKFYRIAKP